MNGYAGGGGGGGRIAVISPNAVQGLSSSNGSNAAGTVPGNPTITIEHVSACTPTITGIVVNNQNAVVVAGTGGVANILGYCLGSATSLQSDGSGLNFTAILSTTDGAITATFQSDLSASGGVHNITVSTANGMSGASPAAQIFVTSVSLQSLSFTGSVAYSRDCSQNSVPVVQPTWPEPYTTVCPPAINYGGGVAGDSVVYVAGNQMSATALLAFNPAPPYEILSLSVEGSSGGFGYFLPAGSVTVPAGSATYPVPVTGNPLPPGETQFINPLSINWYVSQVSSCLGVESSCILAGTSSNPLYITLANSVLPPWAGPIMLTYVKLAVGYGGATNQTTALANTWAQFSTGNGPANVTTWDGRPMQYYTAGFGSCALNAQGIVENMWQYISGGTILNGSYSISAQCGAFAFLLESALAVNGIHSNWITVSAAYQDASFGSSQWVNMVIKNWCFTGTACWPLGEPTYQDYYPYIYQLTLNPSGDLMVPTPSGGYGDLTNQSGAAGQGEQGSSPPFTPLEKVFALHFIVQIPTLDGNATPGNWYYDPSYGLTYPSAAGFESQAVSGYAYQYFEDLGSGRYHVYAAGTPNIAPNILFSPLVANSM
jgi:hypothetical protein